MRTTLEIDEKLIREIIKVSRAKTMKSAVVIALTEYLKNKRRQELKNMIGAYDTFDLSLKDLEKMRDEE
ncbi:MAG: DUF2191 domain-containing protein [Nitrospirae bacterium CG_4_10_14_3_um_filter_53_41]|nr:MAG: DUF2191 domain-containing protein [Nitrospirae bacterium CG17_big_fil_post_rev_8_21_14_2_50_50_9]PIX84761.1 MAG: DUF2191 domain-containing protein [Nitrospirae bacterium CG_4_10_14_3_um_filter_53_41]